MKGAGAGGQDAAVRRLYERGRAAYPGLDLDESAFAAHLEKACWSSQGGDTAERPSAKDLGESFAEDLFLAAACAARIESAARIFRDRFAVQIRRALMRVSSSAAFRDDVEQQVYEQLFVGGPLAGPQIERYAGRSPLGGWLMVVAQRAGLMVLRAEGVRARARDAAANERLATSLFGAAGRHAEGEAIKDQAEPLVKQALTRALAELPVRQRTIFHLYVVGGAGVERLARMYAVNASTISRWVAKARAEIIARMRTLLSVELRLTPAEAESLMALVTSRLDLSLADLPAPLPDEDAEEGRRRP